MPWRPRPWDRMARSAHGGFDERKPRVGLDRSVGPHHDFDTEVLRNEMHRIAAGQHVDVYPERDRGRNDGPALPPGEWGDVSPASSEIDPCGRRGVRAARTRHRTCHWCRVASSPRMSMLTPFTRRFIP